jgi:hypothetical protein
MPNNVHLASKDARGGHFAPAQFNEPPDLASFLRGWTYNPQNNAKYVQAARGRQFVLVRQPMGLEQYERDGRPDGIRPYGRDSALEFHLSRWAAAKRLGSADAFRLARADCAELSEESLMFYRRALVFLALKDWARAARDAAWNLKLLGFVRRSAALEEDRQQLEGWRPGLTQMNALAQAMIHLEKGQDGQALVTALAGIPEFQSQSTFRGDDGKGLSGALQRTWRHLLAHPPDLHRHEAAVFRLEGDFWRIGYQGQVAYLKSTRGLHCLACLLRRPGQECHVTDFISHCQESPAAIQDAGPESLPCRGADPFGACQVLDPRAKAEYRRRVQELRAELELAQSYNDPERATRAREELDVIAQQLSSAIGLNGRDRRNGCPAERARSAVSKRIKEAIRRIGKELPALGHHLTARVRTGYFCAYDPHPEYPVHWTF